MKSSHDDWEMCLEEGSRTPIDLGPPSQKKKQKPLSKASILIASSRARKAQKVKSTRQIAMPANAEKKATALTTGEKLRNLYGETLLGCKTVEEVRTWLSNTYSVFNRKALAGGGRRKQTDQTRADITRLMTDHSASSIFHMANGRMVLETFDRLHVKLHRAVATDPPKEAALVTVISGDGGTSLDHPMIGLHHAQKRLRAMLNSMKVDWFAISELAFFNSHTHPGGGQHLQMHEHAIIWGENLSMVQAAAKRHLSKFTPNITDADIVDIKPLYGIDEVNIARMAAYLLKAPSRAMTWCPPHDGKKGHMHHSEEGDRKMRYFKLAIMRSLLTFEDCSFAGGAAKALRRELLDLTKKLANADAKRPLRFHPDVLPTFWAKTMQELKIRNWSLPVIFRRP